MASLHTYTFLRDAPPASAAGHHSSFSSNLILILTLLSLCHALFSFILMWRGGLDDPVSRWSFDDPRKFPGMDTSPSGTLLQSSSQSSDCTTLLGNSNAAAFAHFWDWKSKFQSDLKPKVIGVSTFSLFVEGKDALPTVSSVLDSIAGVKVIYRTKELEKQQASSRIWNETWLSSFFYKPCNFELFVKQSLNMEMVLVMAMDAEVGWIIHLDTDERIHPAGAWEYSLRQLLRDVPGNGDMVIFPNYESSIERDDIKEHFTEVSMFKKNYDHLTKDTYFGMYEESTRGNPNYFLTCGNGKSAGRVRDPLRPNGAHRWQNYMKIPTDIKLDEAAVLHYTYTKFSNLTSRRDPCSCKPTKDGVKRCFMLEFDREAFTVASTASKEELLNWYREHVVWNYPSLILKLLIKGILTRIYVPTTIMHGLKESGIFESIFESAQESFSKLKGSNNSSRTAEPIQTFPRKMSRHIGSRATERKSLVATNFQFQEATAVPPLSPPAMDLDPEA